MASAAEIVSLLKLEPHPEGGFYRQTFADAVDGDRARSTAIYYLLEGGARGRWHQVDSAEVWHFYDGAPLRLTMSADGKSKTDVVLGLDLAAGEGRRSSCRVDTGGQRRALAVGACRLHGGAGFEFDRFEMAPEGWEPGGG